MDIVTLITLVIAYVLGSIPFGLVLSKIMGYGDIRNIGSGNIGATNALRTGNKKFAALTLLCDILKGTAAVILARYTAPEYAALAGFTALLGHVFPVWLKFKGGKGVATALGILLGLAPMVFLATAGTWLLVFKFMRISSLSALTAFAFAPIYGYLSGDMQLTLMMLLTTILIFVTHRANLGRLLRGEETPFKRKNTDA